MAVDYSIRALTTREAIAEWITFANPADNDKITRLINTASDAIARACNAEFYYQAGIVASLPGWGTKDLILPRGPVLAVSSVKIDGVLLDAADYTIADAGARLLEMINGTWPWTAREVGSIGGGPLPGTEDRDIEVTFTAGYRLPKDDAPTATPPVVRTLPWDLEGAAIDYVRWLYFGRKRDPAVKSKAVLDASVSYNGFEVPAGIVATLKLYTRAAVG